MGETTAPDATDRSGPAGPGEAWFTLRWTDEAVLMLDQRLLPGEERVLSLRSVEEVARAIEDLVIRGAPAIGCAAAMGMARAALDAEAGNPEALRQALAPARQRLARTRPTAVNLFWALDRMQAVLETEVPAGPEGVTRLRRRLVDGARGLAEQDRECCRAIGRAALPLVPEKARILTHCNAGALATAGYGTALGVVRAAAEAGRAPTVLADETRPYLQGARLTAWELDRDGIPVTVITDGMAAAMMARGEVDLVVVGADRVAANGDVANKIGTYGLAVLARAHRIPFVVAAPCSTLDPDTPDGDAIPIEERSRDEVARWAGVAVVPDGVPVRHPAFDVTPAELVDALVTERGVLRHPDAGSLAPWLSRRG